MGIKTLESNLHEIYQSKKLVADFSGKRLYSSMSGWGRFYTWVYEMAEIMGLDDLEKKLFQSSMAHTHKQFKVHLIKVEEASKAYQAHLQKLCRGEESAERPIAKKRRLLCDWYRTVNQFVKLEKNVYPANIRNIISTGFLEHYSKEYKIPFSEDAIGKQLKCQRRIMKMEGILKKPLPANVLLKASEGVTLEKQEKKTLKSFVKKLDKHQNQIGIRLLHGALQGIISARDESASTKSNITVLEMALANLDCKQILQADQKHINKRELLNPGDEIICNRRVLILGERLGVNRDEFDQNMIFATNDPTIVVSIGVNQVIHHLKRVLVRDESWGIKSAKYKDIDSQSGYALIERLYDHLGSYTWVSNSDEIDPKDDDLASPISQLIKWFLKQNRTPLNFSPKYLMFSQKGDLKCLKVTLKTGLDYNALVQFVYECSSGNLHIYRSLMQKSDLSSHSYAKYYQDIVTFAARDEKHAAEDVAVARDIIDSRIVERGKELTEEVAFLKAKCRAFFNAKGYFGSTQGLIKEIAEELLVSYKASFSAGMLPDFMEADIIERVRKRQADARNESK